MDNKKKFKYVFVFSALLMLLIVTASAPAMARSGNGWGNHDFIRFYTPRPNNDAWDQIIDLFRNHEKADALRILNMVKTPQAVWFTGNTPEEVEWEVKLTTWRAARRRAVPILVAYNIPFRDCAQFSAGGATTVEEYKEWIDGFAAGIGQKEAIVILEPDGLGIIPWYTTFEGVQEWCQPAEANEETAAAERFEMLNYAVDVLKAQPNVKVYLDGTHNGWLNVGDISDRLIKAGIMNADGFYLNASNYQYTTNLTQYGTWISSCISTGNPGGCANQYWNGGPEGTKIADLLGPWNGVALSSFGEWSDDSEVPELNTSGINARYAGTEPTTHFVIDTSRNGQGPWDPSAAGYPDPQDWCNPPGRGLGIPTTTDTGNSLIDAYLWIKIPGESDGECTRGLGNAGETVDPEWGLIDPAAGDWFPEMALELVQNANPPLLP